MILRTLILTLALIVQPLMGWSYTSCIAPVGSATGAMSCCGGSSDDGCSGGCAGCGTSDAPKSATEAAPTSCNSSLPAGLSAASSCCSPKTCVLTKTGPTLTVVKREALKLPTAQPEPLPPVFVLLTLDRPIFSTPFGTPRARAGPMDGSSRTRRAMLCIRTI